MKANKIVIMSVCISAGVLAMMISLLVLFCRLKRGLIAQEENSLAAVDDGRGGLKNRGAGELGEKLSTPDEDVPEIIFIPYVPPPLTGANLLYLLKHLSLFELSHSPKTAREDFYKDWGRARNFFNAVFFLDDDRAAFGFSDSVQRKYLPQIRELFYKCQVFFNKYPYADNNGEKFDDSLHEFFAELKNINDEARQLDEMANLYDRKFTY